MKRALTIGLLCAALGGCAGVASLSTDYNTDFESSGTAHGDEVLGVMAVSVNPVFTSDEGIATGDASAAQRFTEAFSGKFGIDFPARLRERGVDVASPGRGMPLFRVSVSGYRSGCRGQECKPQVLITGSVLSSTGKRIWSFSDWVTVEYMDDTGYETLYRQLLAEMLKDQVIPKD